MKNKQKKIYKGEKQALRQNNKNQNIINEADCSCEQKSPIRKELIRLLIGSAIFALAVFLPLEGVPRIAVYLAAYLVLGLKVNISAMRNIFKGRVFNEYFLMSLATVGAFIIGEYPEAVTVMLFYLIGELFQSKAVEKSKRSIRNLLEIMPSEAHLIKEGKTIDVSPETVKINEEIEIFPGEKVPLDGTILVGEGAVDMSALTGESIPVPIVTGDKILSGSINMNAPLTVKVEKEFKDSTVSRILGLIESASDKKAPTERFMTRFAKIYTPIVVLIAALIAVFPPLLLADAQWNQWIYRALIFLVVSCPCALVISIPLGFFGGIAGASKKGVLVKGGQYLEALNRVDSIIFDKTGTLTKGRMQVEEIEAFAPFVKETVLKYAAYAESQSTHPIARAVLEAYDTHIDANERKKIEETVGKGIKAIIFGKKTYVGTRTFLEGLNIDVPEGNNGHYVHVAVDDVYAGRIIFEDQIKEGSEIVIKELKQQGIKNIAMLSGDKKSVAEKVGQALGIDQVFAQILPDEKVRILDQFIKQKKRKHSVIYVGDGINDAPVLARADVGMAMGALGSDAAIEAADIVITDDRLEKIPTAIRQAKRTKKIVFQNIVLAMSIKILFMILGGLGVSGIWEAIFADVGVALLAVLNATRAMR